MTRQDRLNKITDIIFDKPYITKLELSNMLNVTELLLREIF